MSDRDIKGPGPTFTDPTFQKRFDYGQGRRDPYDDRLKQTKALVERAQRERRELEADGNAPPAAEGAGKPQPAAGDGFGFPGPSPALGKENIPPVAAGKENAPPVAGGAHPAAPAVAPQIGALPGGSSPFNLRLDNVLTHHKRRKRKGDELWETQVKNSDVPPEAHLAATNSVIRKGAALREDPNPELVVAPDFHAHGPARDMRDVDIRLTDVSMERRTEETRQAILKNARVRAGARGTPDPTPIDRPNFKPQVMGEPAFDIDVVHNHVPMEGRLAETERVLQKGADARSVASGRPVKKMKIEAPRLERPLDPSRYFEADLGPKVSVEARRVETADIIRRAREARNAARGAPTPVGKVEITDPEKVLRSMTLPRGDQLFDIAPRLYRGVTQKSRAIETYMILAKAREARFRVVNGRLGDWEKLTPPQGRRALYYGDDQFHNPYWYAPDPDQDNTDLKRMLMNQQNLDRMQATHMHFDVNKRFDYGVQDRDFTAQLLEQQRWERDRRLMQDQIYRDQQDLMNNQQTYQQTNQQSYHYNANTNNYDYY